MAYVEDLSTPDRDMFVVKGKRGVVGYYWDRKAAEKVVKALNKAKEWEI